MNLKQVLQTLKSHGNPQNVEGMARFGIRSARAFGVPTPFIRRLAKEVGTDHELALRLWRTGILEARAIAALIGDPQKVTKTLMNAWAAEFDNWAVCDGVCGNLFDKTPFAYEIALRWAGRKEEFVKRAGFVLMASLAVHDKRGRDGLFLKFLRPIKRESGDERNFVKKAVNWALRQIGKRNLRLHAAALKTAGEIRGQNSSSARWIAADAIRELESAAVYRRLSGSR